MSASKSKPKADDKKPAASKHEEKPQDDGMQPMSETPTAEDERSTLLDPRTSTSSGDPPAALTPSGERLGSRI